MPGPIIIAAIAAATLRQRMSADRATTAIPLEMKRLVVTSPGNGGSVADCMVEVQTVPTPTLKPGEVLIKVVAAPVNPSDYGGWYKSSPSSSYPMPMGKEGCGIVISSASEGGLMSGITSSFRCPVGTKVGFVVTDPSQGSYSEYVAVSAMTGAFPMPEDVPIEDCASFFVNPYTAVGILDTAQQAGSSRAIVHTAAASQLGQMLNKLAAANGMEIINVVRRQEQREVLDKLGAKHIVVAADGVDDTTWKAELRDKVKDLGATCAFDAVSGDMTGHLLDCMPSGGVVYVYGVLAGKANGIDPLDLIYRRKQLKGFFLTSWLREGGAMRMIPRMLSAGGTVNSGLKAPDGWCRSQFVDTTMEEAHVEIVRLLGTTITGKKLRIRFDGR